MFRSKQCRTAAASRARTALLWGVTAFVAAQLGLDVALNAWRPLRDPEYGRRLASLQARAAERGPGRPLVLFVGSSRIATTIRPDLLAANRPAEGGGPVVFNYGICNAGPVVELLTLRRLLADGVRPDCVFVEVYPWMAAWPADAQVLYWPPQRLGWQDLRTLRPFVAAPQARRRLWWQEQAVPWLSLRTRLLNQWAPSLVPPAGCDATNYAGLDGWGWLRVPLFAGDDGQLPARLAKARPLFVGDAERFAASEASARAYHELFDLCRAERITAVLIAMPDYFVADYSAVARGRMEDFIRGLSAANGAPLIDARGWAAEEDYFDGAHLTQRGGAAFTQRLERDVLRPYLAGDPPERRWPPGLLNASPAALP